MTLPTYLKAAAGNSAIAGEVAEAIDFDGTNDYLSRASDLTGNSDSGTFTCSFWVWNGLPLGSWNRFFYTTDNARFYVGVGNTQIEVVGKKSTGTTVLSISSASVVDSATRNTWMHFLISVDLSSSSLRRIYINDVSASITVSTYTTGEIIDFTDFPHLIAKSGLSGVQPARVSNFYLDHTYRNLTVEANRRLFVTADLKPAAGQASLNPILYLPMNDPTAPGANAGTGGNFTLTGTIARSGRGPNQYNAPYSDLDGSNDYVNRIEGIVGIADSNLLTVSFCMNLDIVSSGYLWEINGPDGDRPVRMYLETNGEITFQGFAGPFQILNGRTVGTSFKVGRNYVITASVDMSSSAKRHFYVNGQAVSMTWSTYINSSLTLTSQFVAIGGAANGGGRVNGRMGAFWLNNSYADLSVQATREKFVTGTGIDAKPVDLGATGELPTGTSAKVYLPMYGNNAGKNYGTGGNFTVNSGPYPGARGPNEFWGNKATFDGSTGYLSRTSALSGVSDGTTLSFSFFVKPDITAGNQTFICMGNSGGSQFYINAYTTATGFTVSLRTSANALLASFAYTGGTLSTSTVSHICLMTDITNASLRGCYLNGVSVGSWSVYNTGSGNFALASPRVNIAARTDLTPAVDVLDGYLSEFYFTTDYIDFSQEANRLKFRDAFGNPVDLTQQIEDAAIPNPAIYMRFPPTSFGTNYGTGGNFTVNGTITDGGQL